MIGKDYIYPGIFPLKYETHGGDDVGVFALGNLDLLFSRRHNKHLQLSFFYEYIWSAHRLHVAFVHRRLRAKHNTASDWLCSVHRRRYHRVQSVFIALDLDNGYPRRIRTRYLLNSIVFFSYCRSSFVILFILLLASVVDGTMFETFFG